MNNTKKQQATIRRLYILLAFPNNKRMSISTKKLWRRSTDLMTYLAAKSPTQPTRTKLSYVPVPLIVYDPSGTFVGLIDVVSLQFTTLNISYN